MKTEFKTKFLQYLNQRNQEEKGFTLIELLVVIIIIGILSAIALPSFLSQANKAKESEAKQYTGSMNRSQQAKYSENNKFATTVDELGMGIKTQTTNFTYKVDGTTSGPVQNQGTPIVGALRPYTGVVLLTGNTNTSESTTSAFLCVQKVTGQAVLAITGTDCGTTADPVTK
jgi:type IV pilus assembly protein PilA